MSQPRLIFLLDLDSLASSLTYAYLSSTPATQLLPLLHIPAADLSLRPEFKAALSHADVSPSDLLTLDDLGPESGWVSPSQTFWHIVDHNVMTGALGATYGDHVKAIVDHHDDESRSPDANPRIITKAGSCSSLVVELLGEKLQKETDAGIAKVALASLLIDTGNFTSKDKVTKHDTDALEKLKAVIEPSIDIDQFYHGIQTAKQDIDSLSLRDVLRKDYKEWKENGKKLGVASVVKPLEYLLEKAIKENNKPDKADSFLAAAKSYASERGLDMLAIMTTFTDRDDQFARELFVWALNESACPIAERFEKASSQELELQPFPQDILNSTNSGEWRKVWVQQALQHSRKRVAPLLREAMGASKL
jgi:exopolyphosphatase